MEHGLAVECGVDIKADCQEVFDVIHDYGIRLFHRETRKRLESLKRYIETRV